MSELVEKMHGKEELIVAAGRTTASNVTQKSDWPRHVNTGGRWLGAGI